MTTTTTPATTTPAASFDKAAFLLAGMELLRSFEPEEREEASALAIPGHLKTADERRAFCLLSSAMFASAGLNKPAIAWRIKHAAETGVISAAAAWRFSASRVASNAIDRAETETRAVIRHLALARFAERTAVASERTAAATERMATAYEVLMAIALVEKGTDAQGVHARLDAIKKVAAGQREAEAKIEPERSAVKAKADAEAAEAKAKAEALKAA